MRHIRLLNVPESGTVGPKCEAWGAFSTRVWSTDHELIADAGHLCNLLGLDAVATPGDNITEGRETAEEIAEELCES